MPHHKHTLSYTITMKNIIFATITAAAIMLAIAVSNGKLGGVSDLEARRRAAEPISR